MISGTALLSASTAAFSGSVRLSLPSDLERHGPLTRLEQLTQHHCL